MQILCDAFIVHENFMRVGCVKPEDVLSRLMQIQDKLRRLNCMICNDLCFILVGLYVQKR